MRVTELEVMENQNTFEKKNHKNNNKKKISKTAKNIFKKDNRKKPKN